MLDDKDIERLKKMLLEIAAADAYYKGDKYGAGQKQTIVSNCNTITFTNQGLGDVLINNTLLRAGVALDSTTGLPVFPATADSLPTTGGSYTDEFYPYEFNTSQYQVTPLTTFPTLIYIRRKFYRAWKRQ